MAAMDDETRIKLIGLRTIADEFLRQQDTLRRAVANLVGLDPNEEGSWAADFVYDRNIAVERLWDMTSDKREQPK